MESLLRVWLVSSKTDESTINDKVQGSNSLSLKAKLAPKSQGCSKHLLLCYLWMSLFSIIRLTYAEVAPLAGENIRLEGESSRAAFHSINLQPIKPNPSSNPLKKSQRFLETRPVPGNFDYHSFMPSMNQRQLTKGLGWDEKWSTSLIGTFIQHVCWVGPSNMVVFQYTYGGYITPG